jgi:hypothetical protein
MKTAPVMPPPRPPRAGNIAMGCPDWHDHPHAGRGAKWLFYGRVFLKFLVLFLLAVSVGQLALIIFNIVRLQFFS